MRTLVFDTETTGLTKHPMAKDEVQPRVIEFAGIIIDEACNELEVVHTLVNPREAISEEITKITGLTDADVEDAPQFAEVADLIRDAFNRTDARCGHNLPFDDTMLRLEFARLQSSWRPKSRGICSVQEYLPLYGRRPRLKELYPTLTGQSWEQNHRALDDVRALVAVLKESGIIETYDKAESWGL